MKILLVDDELHVAASVRPALRGNYRLESVADGREAFDLLKNRPGEFALVITDHMMPGWAGAELIKRLQVAGFPGRYMVLSAYMSPEIEKIYRGLGVDHIIRKPFDLDELRLAVSQIEHSIDEGAD